MSVTTVRLLAPMLLSLLATIVSVLIVKSYVLVRTHLQTSEIIERTYHPLFFCSLSSPNVDGSSMTATSSGVIFSALGWNL